MVDILVGYIRGMVTVLQGFWLQCRELSCCGPLFIAIYIRDFETIKFKTYLL